MSQIYTTHRASQPKAPAGPASAPPDVIGNQAMTDLLSGGKNEGLGSALDERMQERFLRFAQHQIPRAEQEADQIASGVQGARTPEEVKEQLGSQMGADFSDVRFHTGADAENRATSIGARAYTTGKDVYFGVGGFDPDTAAHELVHTVQQGVVSSGMETVSAPAGGVQMLGILDKLKTAWTSVKEFLGGKMGLLGPSSEEKDQARDAAARGDFSRSARMRKADAQSLTDVRKRQIRAGQIDLNDRSATAALDPFTRKAMSQMAKDPTTDEGLQGQLRTAMEDMDQQMMVNTMLAPTDAQQANLVQHYQSREDQQRLVREYEMSEDGKTYLGGEEKATGETPEGFRERTRREAVSGNRTQEEAEQLAAQDLERAKNSGDVMLRTMLLMQMGQFNRTDEERNPERRRGQFWKPKKIQHSREWDQTMANAFSHGGRTGFIFDSTKADGGSMDLVTEQLFGAGMGAAAGVHTRAAGTHHIVTPDANQEGGYKEQGGVSAALASMVDGEYQHYGMDMAIGGIGNAGTASGMDDGGHLKTQMINADGRSGHMYIGKRNSSERKKGGLLMGLESDSPYRMNQTGHMHNAAAVAEEGSSTGGLKTDLQGKKYGGRTVDISGLRNNEVADILAQFTAFTDRIRGTDQHEALIRQISGQQMGAGALKQLMSQFMSTRPGESDRQKADRLKDLIQRARGLSNIAE